MRLRVLVDTGPLVALQDRRDRFHRWVVDELGQVESPLLTCEAVLTEACFLVRESTAAVAGLLEMVSRGELQVAFRLEEESERVRKLMIRYASVPMSLADACLVRMAEIHEPSQVWTLDGDFRIYRKHGRQVIATIMPQS
jgi:predicted nucleic acid-binding protein